MQISNDVRDETKRRLKETKSVERAALLVRADIRSAMRACDVPLQILLADVERAIIEYARQIDAARAPSAMARFLAGESVDLSLTIVRAPDATPDVAAAIPSETASFERMGEQLANNGARSWECPQDSCGTINAIADQFCGSCGCRRPDAKKNGKSGGTKIPRRPIQPTKGGPSAALASESVTSDVSA